MGKRYPDTSNPKTIKKFIKQGRGQGYGADYKPWIYPWDFPSEGISSRTPTWKVAPRSFYPLSNHEKHYFYSLEWDDSVVDYREQYPLLPLEETKSLAEELDIEHPLNHYRRPCVMTTDFLVRRILQSQEFEEAVAIKPADTLEDIRTLEKLEIERRYWHNRGIRWKIVTDRDIDTVLAHNVETIHELRNDERISRHPAKVIDDIERRLKVLLQQSPAAPFSELALSCDKELSLERRTSLTVAKHLVANKRLAVDLKQPFNTAEALHLLDAK